MEHADVTLFRIGRPLRTVVLALVIFSWPSFQRFAWSCSRVGVSLAALGRAVNTPLVVEARKGHSRYRAWAASLYTLVSPSWAWVNCRKCVPCPHREGGL